MTNTTYTLQLVPKGYKVVPEELSDEMYQVLRMYTRDPYEIYDPLIKEAPPFNTLPVLRWSGGWRLEFNGNKIASLHCWGDGKWTYELWDKESYSYETEQEARRAAEKALGFPDGLIIEEV